MFAGESGQRPCQSRTVTPRLRHRFFNSVSSQSTMYRSAFIPYESLGATCPGNFVIVVPPWLSGRALARSVHAIWTGL